MCYNLDAFFFSAYNREEKNKIDRLDEDSSKHFWKVEITGVLSNSYRDINEEFWQMILYVSVFWLSVIISVSFFPVYKRALEFEKQGDDSLLVVLVIGLGKQHLNFQCMNVYIHIVFTFFCCERSLYCSANNNRHHNYLYMIRMNLPYCAYCFLFEVGCQTLITIKWCWLIFKNKFRAFCLFYTLYISRKILCILRRKMQSQKNIFFLNSIKYTPTKK